MVLSGEGVERCMWAGRGMWGGAVMDLVDVYGRCLKSSQYRSSDKRAWRGQRW